MSNIQNQIMDTFSKITSGKLTGIEGMLLEAKYPIERLKRVEQSQFIKN